MDNIIFLDAAVIFLTIAVIANCNTIANVFNHSCKQDKLIQELEEKIRTQFNLACKSENELERIFSIVNDHLLDFKSRIKKLEEQSSQDQKNVMGSFNGFSDCCNEKVWCAEKPLWNCCFFCNKCDKTCRVIVTDKEIK